MAAQRIDSLFCNFPTPFFSGFWSFCGAGKFYQNGVPRRQLTGTAPFFGKSDPARWTANITRSGFRQSTYFFVIFRRRFFPDLIILRSREILRKWRPATKPHGRGAVFWKIGLHALGRKLNAK
jgi:hypothetical protein